MNFCLLMLTLHPTQKLCIHFVFLYTKIVQDICNWCMQNVYLILTNFCMHFVYKNKRTMPAKFYIQNVYKSLLKCGIHFVYKHFVYILYTKSKELCQLKFLYKMYTKVCQNVRCVLYTNILYKSCIHQFWSTKSVHHKHIYTIWYKIHIECIYK